jgi:glycogen debranching enzyme
VEYSRHSANGLVSQGWKDSAESIFHADGSDVSPPVALCEVQGYVYQAKREAAYLCRQQGKQEKAAVLLREAEALRKRFHEAFWCQELGTYAMALDGKKRPCKVVGSNIGHCLYSGIIHPDYAGSVVNALMGERSFCGWGLRTIAAGEARYNPMSYHNGSIWPHDNSLIAMGLARYGWKNYACALLEGMFEVSRYMDLNRLPELFCGFTRREGQGPTLYPMSCAPQAWAAGAVFLLLQSCLGLSQSAEEKKIQLDSPCLPASLRRVYIRGLRLGKGVSVDLEVVRRAKDVGLHVLSREGDVSVVAIQ